MRCDAMRCCRFESQLNNPINQPKGNTVNHYTDLTDLMPALIRNAPLPIFSISFEFPGHLSITTSDEVKYSLGFDNNGVPLSACRFTWNTEDCTVVGAFPYHSNAETVAKTFWQSVADSNHSRKTGAEKALRELQENDVLSTFHLTAEVASTGGGCYSVFVTGESEDVGLEVTYEWFSGNEWVDGHWSHSLGFYDRKNGTTLANDETTHLNGSETPIADWVTLNSAILRWRWML